MWRLLILLGSAAFASAALQPDANGTGDGDGAGEEDPPDRPDVDAIEKRARSAEERAALAEEKADAVEEELRAVQAGQTAREKAEELSTGASWEEEITNDSDAKSADAAES